MAGHPLHKIAKATDTFEPSLVHVSSELLDTLVASIDK
jgi:hypothetical protein